MATARAQITTILNRLIRGVKPTRGEYQELGNYSAELIRKRTRLGFGVEKNLGRPKSLRSMRRHKPSYTEFRKKNRHLLAKFTSPKKHNLTFTGQMLGSLRAYVRRRKVSVEVDKSIFRTKRENQVIANVNARRGWKFLSISKPEVKLVREFYEDKILAKKLRRYK